MTTMIRARGKSYEFEKDMRDTAKWRYRAFAIVVRWCVLIRTVRFDIEVEMLS